MQSDVIPSRKLKKPFYYTLGTAGARYLESVGCDVSESWRASKEINQHALFVEHTLELNDLLISALLLHLSVPSVTLHGFTHERALKRHPYRATWQTNGQTQTFTVIPDAFLEFRVRVAGRVRRMPVLLEHDRGTEEQYYFRRRTRAYIMLLKTGSYQQLFGTSAVTIAFTTHTGQHRVEQMRAWTRAELEHEPPEVGALFRFAVLPQPMHPSAVWLGPHWYSPYDAQQPQALLAA